MWNKKNSGAIISHSPEVRLYGILQADRELGVGCLRP